MNAPTGRPRHGDDHEPFEELAVGWALHALEPEDEALFAAHLPGCARCARTVADTQEVMGALAGGLPEDEPSESLRDRLRAAVEETEQLPPPAPPAREPAPAPTAPRPAGPARPSGARAAFPGGLRPPHLPRDPDLRPNWRRALPSGLVAAAVAAILALGTWNVVLAGDRDKAQQTIAEQSRVLQGLLQPGHPAIAPLDDGNGRSVATVVARDGKVQVVTNGLRVNDQKSHVYVVWGVQGGSSPVALGTFDVVTASTDLRTVGSARTGLDEFPSYAISLEPGRQAPTKPSDIVANGQVDS